MQLIIEKESRRWVEFYAGVAIGALVAWFLLSLI